MGTNYSTNTDVRFANCDKLRIADSGTNKNFLGCCLDNDTQLLTIWSITINKNNIQINQPAGSYLMQFEKVIDFDTTSVVNSGTDIFFITSAQDTRHMISFKQVFYSSSGWDISQPVETYKPFPEDGTTPKDSYILNGIAAHLNDDSHNS